METYWDPPNIFITTYDFYRYVMKNSGYDDKILM